MLVAKRDPVFGKDLLKMARKKKRWWGWLLNENNDYESDSSYSIQSDSSGSRRSDDPFAESDNDVVEDIKKPINLSEKRKRRVQMAKKMYNGSRPEREIDYSSEEKEFEVEKPTFSSLPTNPYAPKLSTDFNNTNIKFSKKKTQTQYQRKQAFYKKAPRPKRQKIVKR